MTEHVLSALTKRRAELAGEAAQLRVRLAAIAADTGHLKTQGATFEGATLTDVKGLSQAAVAGRVN